MAKKKQARTEEKSKAEAAAPPHRLAVALLFLFVLAFHFTPLFSGQASIQWDAVDVHYTLQKHFSESVWEGRLPYWTRYVFSGYPFLADPQVGAWYPLNWPFFLAGITPKSIQWELALHTLIAALGAYLLGWHWMKRVEPSLLMAVAYAFSGFFTGHASHVGIFQAAAWLPLLLLAVEKALRGGIFWLTAASSITGLVILVGHFQTALYCGFAVACLCAWRVIENRKLAVRAWLLLALAAAGGLAIGMVLINPGLQLAGESVRAEADFTKQTNSPLTFAALATLIQPNALGALEGEYKGSGDITQSYFYAGLLLLPLVAMGIWKSPVRSVGLVLVIPALWYALGPDGGLYRLLALLPGLGAVRAPVHLWFVVALGLALLAGGGLLAFRERIPAWVPWVVVLVLFGDLMWRNSIDNRLAYAPESFAALYGDKLQAFEQNLAAKLPPRERFHAPYPSASFGPQNHPIDAKTETTYGYNPLVLRRYSEYLGAAQGNRKLINALGARFVLDLERQGVAVNEEALPRVMLPKRVEAVTDDASARQRLSQLDPAEAVIVVGAPKEQDPSGAAELIEQGEGFYRIRYRLSRPALLRLAEAYYPGWRAHAGGRDLEVVPVDLALIGVRVPQGEGELLLHFKLPRFAAMAAVSALSMLGALFLLWLRRKECCNVPEHQNPVQL